MKSKDNKGFSLVEVLLATALLSLFLAAVTASFVYGLRGVGWGGDRAQAVFLAEEGLAAAQNVRDAGFTGLSDGTFGLSSSGSQWAFSGSSDTTENFTRQLVISSIDSTIKSVTSTVTWPKSGTSTGTVSLVTYLSNWIANTVTGWAAAVQSGTYNASGSQNGLKVQVSGNYAYLVRAGGSPDFLVFDITTPTSPRLVSSLNIGSTPTNIAVSGDYAYVTGASNTQELRIIYIANPEVPGIVGTYNAIGNADALGVAVVGNTAYITRATSTDPEFVAINVTTKTAPTTLGSLELGDSGYDVAISGSYAYVASYNDAQELQVVNITPATPTLAGSYNIGGTTNANTLAINGTSLFLGHGSNLRTFRISSPTAPAMINTYSLIGGIYDFAVDGANYLFAVTNSSTNDFQVIDVSIPASPARLVSVNLTGIAAAGVAYDPTLDQCAVAGTDDATEFIMVTHP